MTLPQHAVSVWLGHSETVSRKHYLLVPDELFDRASRKVQIAPEEGSAKCAAVGSGTNSQALATPSECTDVASQEYSAKQGIFSHDDAPTCTSGARGRTGDLGVMNPTL